MRLSKNEWIEKLNDLSDYLGESGQPINIVTIGSVPLVFLGLPGRTTSDIDVWNSESKFSTSEFSKAAVKAGLLFNPTENYDPNKPYIQLVDNSIVKVGPINKKNLIKIYSNKRLNVYAAPVENIIASKLVRMDARDIEDVIFLQSKFKPDINTIKKIVSSFPEPQRTTAKENLIYLGL